MYSDNRGRRRWGSAETLMEARTSQAASRADVARGEFRAFSRVTFEAYSTEWIDSYAGRTKNGIGENTRDDYRKTLERSAIPFFGRKRLTEIEPRDIKRYAAHVASRGLARDTVRLALAPVKALLATAVEEGLIRSNPALGLRNLLPQVPDDQLSSEVVKALTEEELGRLLDALPAEWRLFFVFLAQTGVRIGEAVEVRYRDLDLGRQLLNVERRFYRGRVGLPKGRKTRRVRLTSDMAKSLWSARKDGHAIDDDLVFTSERGARIDQSNLMSRVLKPAARAAGIGDWVGFHAFRHTCATVLFRGGWNAVQVQKFLGHADAGFTMRRYIHLLDDDLPQPDFLDKVTAKAGNKVATSTPETHREGLAVRSGT